METTSLPSFFSRQVARAQRFYLDAEKATAQDLVVLCGGRESVTPEYRIDRDDFPFFTFEFIASGAGELSLGGKDYLLSPGSCFAYGPGLSQRIQTSTTNRLTKYFVSFKGERALRLLKSVNMPPGTFTSVFPLADMRAAFDRLLEYGVETSSHTPELCALQLEIILLLSKQTARTGQISSLRARESFDRAMAKAAEKFLELHSARDLAKASYIQISYLCRLFKRFAGVSPNRHLLRLKMTWAAEQLHQSDIRVNSVAERLGIDPFQFSRAFKRVHGISPIVFQRLRAHAPQRPGRVTA
ncbi:MAG TPA: AraC family transcriptional regulator [Opitutaceae bacterium]|nr:AraC family transcriptional regulator [Opitutaceae bacterium]